MRGGKRPGLNIELTRCGPTSRSSKDKRQRGPARIIYLVFPRLGSRLLRPTEPMLTLRDRYTMLPPCTLPRHISVSATTPANSPHGVSPSSRLFAV